MDKTTFDNMTDLERADLLANHDCHADEDDGCEICAWYETLVIEDIDER